MRLLYLLMTTKNTEILGVRFYEEPHGPWAEESSSLLVGAAASTGTLRPVSPGFIHRHTGVGFCADSGEL